MYIVLKFNWDSFNILMNVPKRNYKKFRILLFYTKVLFATLKNRKVYLDSSANIVLEATNKIVWFYGVQFVRVFYHKHAYYNKYYFLRKNRMLDFSVDKENKFVFPYYSKKGTDLGRDLMGDYWNSFSKIIAQLQQISIFQSQEYYTFLYKKLSVIKMNELDNKFFQTIDANINMESIYKTLTHGDLWLGNILIKDDEFVVIDWDDVGCKSISYDIFYFYFQLFGADFNYYHKKYDIIKEKVLPKIIDLAEFHRVLINEEDYDDYYRIFLVERLLKRYG